MTELNYDDVSGYTLDDRDEQELIARQTECTFMWTNREGWPVGVIMSYVWHEQAFWLSVSALRVRVAAVTRDPRVAVCISSMGTGMPGSKTVTYKGRCEVFADAGTIGWFLPALAVRLRPGDPVAQEQFVRLNDTPNRRVLKVTPTQRIGYDGLKMAARTRQWVADGAR